MSDLAQFAITLKPGHAPKVAINGTNVPGVIGVRTIQDAYDDIPVVILEAHADAVSVVGEGGIGLTLGQSIDEFLDGINPDELQSQMIRRGNMSTPPAETVLAILKEKAAGA